MVKKRRSARRRKLSTRKRLRNCCRAFVAFVGSNVGIVVLFIGYAILGAFAFCHIEGADEQLRKYKMAALRRRTVEELWNITRQLNIIYPGDWNELVGSRIHDYQLLVVQSYNKGYDGKDEATSQWSFSGGFLYSLTVMTTIGYGNIAPHTPLGKLSTILYTCIGFPLFLLFLSNIGSLLAHSFKWIYAKLCRCQPVPMTFQVHVHYPSSAAGTQATSGASPRAVHDETALSSAVQVDSDIAESMRQCNTPQVVSSPIPAAEDTHSVIETATSVTGDSCSSSELDLTTITVPISMCLIIMAVYICGGALFFARLENWDFLTSCYFCFISLSTIGFGDYVPGDSISSRSGGLEAGFVLTSMYLMLGMAIIAMCFNLIQEEVIQKVRTCARCLGCLHVNS